MSQRDKKPSRHHGHHDRDEHHHDRHGNHDPQLTHSSSSRAPPAISDSNPNYQGQWVIAYKCNTCHHLQSETDYRRKSFQLPPTPTKCFRNDCPTNQTTGPVSIDHLSAEELEERLRFSRNRLKYFVDGMENFLLSADIADELTTEEKRHQLRIQEIAMKDVESLPHELKLGCK